MRNHAQNPDDTEYFFGDDRDPSPPGHASAPAAAAAASVQVQPQSAQSDAIVDGFGAVDDQSPSPFPGPSGSVRIQINSTADQGEFGSDSQEDGDLSLPPDPSLRDAQPAEGPPSANVIVVD